MIGNNANFDAAKWKSGLLAEYHKKLSKMVRHANPRDTDGELERSLSVSISGANNDPSKILITMALHGMFFDMGVGRGTKSGGQRSNKVSRALIGKETGNRRVAKKFFNKTTTKYIYLAEDILSAQKGEVIIATVTEIIPDKT